MGGTFADDQIIRRAVKGMLPKNSLRKQRLDRLKIFPGAAPPELLKNVLTTWRDPEVQALRAQSKQEPPEGAEKMNAWNQQGEEKVPKWKLAKRA